ncbi:TolC family protein [Nitrosomonas sp.]|uniref:TolC family protein n=1 Tax=Nitrosomonas sp. TaxID=42353 RepID=UPI0026354321|nr:TolC family protein [Nitrosomonas sp.]
MLADFYLHRDQAASVLKVQADLEAQRSNLLAHEAQKGWELFGGVSGGYQKSPFAREPFGHFFDPLARIGLRYPLLGSAERQQRAIEDAATQVKIEGIRLDWSRWLAALFLEENYAAYWSAQKMLVLTDAYIRLRHEGIERLLLKRQEAGLLFMSDYLEFLSAFDQAQRTQIEFSNNKNQALMRLAHLTNSVVMPFEAVKPPLGEIATTIVSDIEQPDLRILQAQIDHLQTIRETENWQGIDSDFSMTAFGGPAIPHPSPDAAQLGYGGAVGFNFRMPLEIISYRKNEQSRLNSQLISLREDYTRRDQELQHEFQSLLNSYQQLTQQIKFQRTRLEAARELIRERYLRLQIMDGDVIEKYFQAINTYYRVAIENVAAESEHWKLHIRLRQFIMLPEAKGKDAYPEISVLTLIEPLQQVKRFLAGGEMPSASTQQTQQPLLRAVQFVPDQFAVYVWNFNHTMTQPEFWTRKPVNEVNRFLISLNARQIAATVADPASLERFLGDGRRHGKKIELLLGDPDWILPKYRKNLLQIIHSLSAIDFDGLHLDIEPDQLVSQLTGADRLEQFIETIRQVTAISPWPVGISIHPRYLARKSSYGLCMPCKFAEAGVREVGVMYYTMNIEKIVTTLKSAMRQHPNLTFSLAQSVEPELGPENSYANKPQRYFNDAMQQLQNQLQAPNFGGLIIQSWLDLRNYLHENPL